MNSISNSFVVCFSFLRGCQQKKIKIAVSAITRTLFSCSHAQCKKFALKYIFCYHTWSLSKLLKKTTDSPFTTKFNTVIVAMR